jgi:hypothetical protein
MPWVWVKQAIVLTIHEKQIAEHGGGSGLRDEGLLGSALARPVNKASYENANAADLAGAYGFGLARNHPFVDGNKRTALGSDLTQHVQPSADEFELRIRYHHHGLAYQKSFYPGARLEGSDTVVYKHPDFYEVARLLRLMN